LIFLLDAIIKIIVQGLYKHKNAYLKNGFNVVDLMIIFAGLIATENDGNGVERAFFLIKCLRPLRIIDSVALVKKHAVTLIYAIPQLFNVLIFLTFIFTTFSIFGIHIFPSGYFGRCRYTPKPVNSTYWPISSNEICGLSSQCPFD
jgi:voltage-dependent calcium channel L type alpha-1S